MNEVQARETLQTLQMQLIDLEHNFESLSLSERKERISEMCPLVQEKQRILGAFPDIKLY